MVEPFASRSEMANGNKTGFPAPESLEVFANFVRGTTDTYLQKHSSSRLGAGIRRSGGVPSLRLLNLHTVLGGKSASQISLDFQSSTK